MGSDPSGTSSDRFLLKSYNAGEDNELSFREGDRITEIDAVSDDWWSGRDQHGNVGLFPGTTFYPFSEPVAHVDGFFSSDVRRIEAGEEGLSGVTVVRQRE